MRRRRFCLIALPFYSADTPEELCRQNNRKIHQDDQVGWIKSFDDCVPEPGHPSDIQRRLFFFICLLSLHICSVLSWSKKIRSRFAFVLFLSILVLFLFVLCYLHPLISLFFSLFDVLLTFSLFLSIPCPFDLFLCFLPSFVLLRPSPIITLDICHISALYKDPAKVPGDVVELMKSQHRNQHSFRLQDFKKMNSSQLLEILEKIVRTSFEPKKYPPYALTDDNLLKMVLIVSPIFVSFSCLFWSSLFLFPSFGLPFFSPNFPVFLFCLWTFSIPFSCPFLSFRPYLSPVPSRLFFLIPFTVFSPFHSSFCLTKIDLREASFLSLSFPWPK